MGRLETPCLAADIIIELTDDSESRIVLIKRKYAPFGWAIPGGFVDVGESVELAAIREAMEETNLCVSLHTLLGIYSNPNRDPRGHTVTAVYIGSASGVPRAADDAKHVESFSIESLPKELAFDHAMVLQDYINFKKTGNLAPLRIS